MAPTAATSTLETVTYEKKNAIAYVTLNRSKVFNALNHRTWEDLKTVFEDARSDATVRGVIVTGAGDKAFIAGATSASSRTSVPSRPRRPAATGRTCSI
jgi:enoyl-CoA hydratase